MLTLRDLFEPPAPLPWVLPNICAYLIRDTRHCALYAGATTRGPTRRLREHWRSVTPLGERMRAAPDLTPDWTVQFKWFTRAFDARHAEILLIEDTQPLFNQHHKSAGTDAF